MVGYYEHHPEMMERLLSVRKIYVEDVTGAKDAEEAAKMKRCIIEELWRKGKGRFRLARSPESADAVLTADMQKDLGPLETGTPLPFELKPKLTVRREVFLRVKLLDPRTKELIFKTTSEERPEIEVDSVEKAAHVVIKNLMSDIEVARGIFGGD